MDFEIPNNDFEGFNRQAEKNSAEKKFLEEFREEGTCFVKTHPLGFFIYAQVEGCHYEEDRETLERMFNDGYIFCRAFSEVCHEGDLGSIHISKIAARISGPGFFWARNNRWPSILTRELQGFVLSTNPTETLGF